MYEDFFGLKEKPFDLTPSPRFVYLSEGHKEALALLKYGVMDRKGFILLTGDVGTGKTTMVRTLLDSLNHTFKYVLLSNPILSPKEFFDYLALSVFKKKIHFQSKAHLLLVLEPYLKKAARNHTNFNLIIDEAHKLSFELLEEIRLLSNMETGNEKLMNIFLVGQPELNEKLSDPRCRPLLQRISIRHHIPPLSLDQTRDYMDIRLRVAGAKKGNGIFPKSAVEAIYSFSQGYPREINVLADNALLLGYSKGRKKISPSMVKACYDDMQLGPSTLQQKAPHIQSPKADKIPPLPSGRGWKWAAVFFFFLAFTAMVSTPIGKAIIWRGSELITSTYHSLALSISENFYSSRNAAYQGLPNKRQGNEIEMQERQSSYFQEKTGQDELEKPSTEIMAEKKTEAVEVRNASMDEDEIEDINKIEMENTVLQQRNEAKTVTEEKKEEPSRIIIVGRGDTLTGLILRIYGSTSDDIIAMVKAANPDLKDINFIRSGQTIVFPQLPELEKRTTFTIHLASYKLYEPAISMYRQLLENGYKVYILPTDDPEKGRIFRVAVGYFNSLKEAKDYAPTLVKQGISTYANPIEVEMSKQ